jgi:tRNA/tmRNA/rRNA uracil-C5-methylase (TrmA/RlmC/RlmD family)
MNQTSGLKVGDELVVEIGPLAHGGHFIAHAHGRTLFVRHAITGERVRVRVTAINSKIVRADAIEVLDANSDRVPAPCRFFGPSACGGCDFQHMSIDYQRRAKSMVIADSMKRYAGLPDVVIPVEDLGGVEGGLGWRTRIRWSVDPSGRVGLLANRTHTVVPIDECLIATPGITASRSAGGSFSGASQVRSIEGSDGKVTTIVDEELVSGPKRSTQVVRDRTWRVDADTFWQVHPRAAEVLVGAVLDLGVPAPGQVWWDLYSGAGLFSAFLGEAVGVTGRVEAVESAASAVRDARRALHDLPQVHLHESSVEAWMRAQPEDARPDGVLLDPPRAGAGRDLVGRIAAMRPGVIVYVACDPVALARDCGTLGELGYRLDGLRAFDTFPMTHHMETVAILRPHKIS